MKKILLLLLFSSAYLNIQSLTMPIEYINVSTTNFNLGKFFVCSLFWGSCASGLIFANTKLIKFLNKKFEEKWSKEIPLTQLFDKMKERNNDKNLLESITWAINFSLWPLVAYLYSESWKNLRIYGRLSIARNLKQDSIQVITGKLPWWSE